jgi:Na+-driven multidrug efflux pump
MYAIQIPFFVSSRVFYRFLVAMRRSDLIFYCGALNLALDIVLNLILMRWFGVAGIALATSLWTVSTFLFPLVLGPGSCFHAHFTPFAGTAPHRDLLEPVTQPGGQPANL